MSDGLKILIREFTIYFTLKLYINKYSQFPTVKALFSC